MWADIYSTNSSNFVDSLELVCNIHGIIIKVNDPADFDKCPNGGCDKICEMQMNCGHSCLSHCHVIDREHKNCFSCIKNCPKKLACKHYCGMKCGHLSECGNCQVLVSKTIDSCKSEIKCECGKSPKQSKCTQKCGKQLACGLHVCQEMCINCEFECGECKVMIDITLQLSQVHRTS
jgi:hypothetical protein